MTMAPHARRRTSSAASAGRGGEVDVAVVVEQRHEGHADAAEQWCGHGPDATGIAAGRGPRTERVGRRRPLQSRPWGSATSRTSSARTPPSGADDVSLVLDDRALTWAELYERAGRVAAGLAAAGVGPQDRVAFLDKNGIEHFEVFFGAALANAVCVDVNWRLAAARGRVHRQRRRGQGARRRARLRAGARRHRRRADDGRHDPRHRRPREVPGLRRVGRRARPRRSAHAERAATTSPSSSTRAARPDGPRA